MVSQNISDTGVRRQFLSRFYEYIPGLLRRSRSDIVVKRAGFSWQVLLGAVLVLAVVLSGIATYAALNAMPPFGNDADAVLWLLTLDLVLLLALVALVARRIVAIWSGRKRGLAGSHLHVKLVYTFSFMAAVPAVIMTVFSVYFFYFGVETWFSERVQTAVNESQAVAQAYLEEHKQVIRADTLAMANDINRQAVLFMTNPAALEKIIQTQSILRNLSEVLVLDSAGQVIARSGLTFSLEFEEIPNEAMDRAREGEVALMTGGNEDRVRALVRLNNFVDAYLFVGRMVDPQVLSHLAATAKASEDYNSLQMRSSRLQIMVTFIFAMIGLLLMFTAIWFGFVLARQLVNPISALITTADRVRAGDLSARVDQHEGIEEFDYLARAFNRMTQQIEEQQKALLEANRQMDRRRRFTETVLAGATSGIIGVDANGLITLANNSASKLLGIENDALSAMRVSDIAEELGALLESAHERADKITQADIQIKNQDDDARRVFLVRIAIELVGDRDVGAIITFDDITDLQSAQRKAAWADVARRIAHEIKNPLTPIQLSAERLKRKYLTEIQTTPEVFSECTDTIIRHVEDIERMVNEFSSFARMPEPTMKRENLAALVRETLSLHIHAHPDIDFNISGGEDAGAFFALCDAQQIRQALNNLVQNAVDSIHARMEATDEKGRVDVLLTTSDAAHAAIVVSDNGLGLPKEEAASRLTEPYVTHKVKGTGLGLAIVKKIMEDHGGDIVLGVSEGLENNPQWRDLGGASVSLVIPLIVSLEQPVIQGCAA